MSVKRSGEIVTTETVTEQVAVADASGGERVTRRRRFTRRTTGNLRLPPRTTLFPNAPFVFGTLELVGACAALVLMVAAVASYFYLLQPARKQLEAIENQQRRDHLLLKEAGDLNIGGTPEIIASLRRFENDRLPTQIEGQTAVIAELNLLVSRNNARNPGFDFVPLESTLNPDGTLTARARSGANAGMQTVYPGLIVRMSVEGAYPNLRRLIRDIETNPRFIIINGIEIESNNEVGSSFVTLRLDMATYFRPNAK